MRFSLLRFPPEAGWRQDDGLGGLNRHPANSSTPILARGVRSRQRERQHPDR